MTTLYHESQTPLMPGRPIHPHHGYNPPSALKKVPIAPWKIDWHKPASMVCLFLVGLGSAAAHHIFYLKLDGTQAKHQEWASRAGTGLAYLFKFSLAAMVGISRDQWLWHTLRTQFLTLKGIDAIFGVTSDPFKFFNGDAVLRAKVLTVMALMKWLFPISAIFTPGTISVVPNQAVANFDCTVLSLDFNYDTENPVPRLGQNYLHEGPGYTSPSPRALIDFTVPFLSDRATPINDSKPFGSQWQTGCATECRYVTEFKGPSINCTEIDFELPNAPWANQWNFSQCESPSETDTELKIPLHVVRRWEGSVNSFWALYTIQGKPDARIACREKHVYTCQASIAHYSVQQIIRGHQFLEPEISVNTLNSIPDNHVPGHKHAYEANWALFDTFFKLAGGGATMSFKLNDTESTNEATTWTNTQIAAILQETTDALGEIIENVVHKMTVSLVSDTSLYYSVNTAATCSSVENYNVYKYDSFILKVTYTAALGISGLIAILGIIALWRNGLASDTSFSTILRTTRNPTLDRRLAGGCLGSAPLPEHLENLKLKFGELSAYTGDYGKPPGYNEDDGVRHVAMGVEGEDRVSSIQKRVRYS